MNAGKTFEKCFKASIPKDVFHLRLRDGTASWSSTEKTRFQHYNPCDMIIHYQGHLFLAELKSHKGKSIPFKCFRETQLNELYKIKQYDTEIAVAVFNFRDYEKTYIVLMTDIEEYITTSTRNGQRKSFPMDWVKEVGYRVEQRKLKVNYKYDVIPALAELIFTLGR
jgi:recombination protein U